MLPGKKYLKFFSPMVVLRFISFYLVFVKKKNIPKFSMKLKYQKNRNLFHFIFLPLRAKEAVWRWNSLIGKIIWAVSFRMLKWMFIQTTNIISTFFLFVWIQSCGLIEVIISSILITFTTYTLTILIHTKRIRLSMSDQQHSVIIHKSTLNTQQLKTY